MEIMAKLGDVLDRTKTPLALAGLVVVVLYGLYYQILHMDIFANIGAEHTFQLVDRMLRYVFWLALLAIVLGVCGYLISLRTKKAE